MPYIDLAHAHLGHVVYHIDICDIIGILLELKSVTHKVLAAVNLPARILLLAMSYIILIAVVSMLICLNSNLCHILR